MGKTKTRCNPDIFANFAEHYLGTIDRVVATPLSGGLDSHGINRVDVTLSASQARRTATFVAKHLRGRGVHELDVYRGLHASHNLSWAPRLLGFHRDTREDVYIFLEWIPAANKWPWVDLDATSAVILQLTKLHAMPISTYQTVLADPEIDREMETSAAETAALYHRSPIGRPLAGTRPMHKAIERVAVDLNTIRSYLTVHTGVAVLHGDVHSGNAVIRAFLGAAEAVLFDWGRARLGSPLEDVASWLQSLSFWEPQVKRRHDTLFARYLKLTGRECRADRDLRKLYWVAAASNAMAGALRYHLAVVSDSSRPDSARQRSARAGRDWMQSRLSE
jgi:hypothetical protein